MRRALLTGVSQLSAKKSEYNAEQLDTDIVEVTAHAGARPEHAAWQGGWYSISGKDETYNGVTYKDIVKATGYGTGAGLMGWNCRHSFFPVIPGVDEPKYTKEELENIDPPPKEIDGEIYTYYEAEQQQRYMERIMRKTKRELVVLQTAGDEEQFIWRSILLRGETEEYVDFCEKTGLIPRPDRYGAVGYGRVISSKAKWSVRKAELKNGAEAAVIGISEAYNDKKGKNSKKELTNHENRSIINSDYHAGFIDKINTIIGNFNQYIFPEYKVVSEDYLKELPKIKESETMQQSLKETNPSNDTHNCQRCVSAYEMRRRGYDVIAQNAPLNPATDNIGNNDFKNVFKNAKWIECEGSGLDEIKSYMDIADMNTRIHISIKTNRGNHLFVAEKTENGTFFCDPQNGKISVEEYFSYKIIRKTEFARVDNLQVTNLIKQCIEVRV